MVFMNNKLYEKVMGLLDVAVDMGTTMPQDVIDKMEELYNNSDNWQEYDYFLHERDNKCIICSIYS